MPVAARSPVLAVALLLAACSAPTPTFMPAPSSAPRPSATHRPSPTPTVRLDGATREICRLDRLIRTDTRGTILDHEENIRRMRQLAAQASVIDVGDAATGLGYAYAAASAARGTGSEESALREAAAAATRLADACARAGWRP